MCNFADAVARRIRSRRRMLGLTQSQLAAACYVRFQQIQKYECGANGISLHRLALIAAALGTTPADLLMGLQIEPDQAERHDKAA